MKAILCRTLDDLDTLAGEVRKIIDAGQIAKVEISRADRNRTLPQNASLHLYCQQMAEKMNDAGYTQRQLVGKFKDGFSLPVTPHMVKDIFREVGRAMYKKESTTDLTTVEIKDVYRVVDQRFAEITGCRAEWPSRENQMMREIT